MFKKGLVIGIIVLFVGVSVMPIAGSIVRVKQSFNYNKILDKRLITNSNGTKCRITKACLQILLVKTFHLPEIKLYFRNVKKLERIYTNARTEPAKYIFPPFLRRR